MRPASYLLVSLLFSALLFGFFLVSERGFLQVRRQRLELARLQAQVSTLDTDNQRLEENIQALRTDPKAVEKIAREDLNFTRPDEIVLALPKGWRARVAPEQAKLAAGMGSGSTPGARGRTPGH